jgi:hypothetical protein
MPSPEPLQPGEYYHIYNRGINGETLFREGRNYHHFLKLWAKYIEPVADTYAYCLLSNHFHFLIRIKEDETGPILKIGPVLDGEQDQTGPVLSISRQFNNLFIAYAKAFNKAYDRTGSLFESPFKRRRVDSDRYFVALVVYIHRNPEEHGFVDGFRRWPYSSYQAILSTRATRIQRAAVLDWFGGAAAFEEVHTGRVDEAVIEPLIVDD